VFYYSILLFEKQLVVIKIPNDLILSEQGIKKIGFLQKTKHEL